MFANIGIQFKKKEKKRKQRTENRREKAIKKMQEVFPPAFLLYRAGSA